MIITETHKKEFILSELVKKTMTAQIILLNICSMSRPYQFSG